MWDQYWKDRGTPWEFDPGPKPSSAFAQLYADTPNYRGIGLYWSGKEEFRWHFGPMFYRGRLEGGTARVLIVGQEGAQDESLSHRSFTGGTGGRMQHALHHLGITHSYLFLNTFVYPIFGQYDAGLRPLAQDARSPIVKHRNALFDEVVAEHPLRLVIAVGAAAKESVATWIRSHGGTAEPDHLELADAHVCAPGLRAVGVLHQGGAGKGGNVSAIIASFKHVVDLVSGWAGGDAGWLPADPDGTRLPSSAYVYRSAPVPFRDLAFGTAWRLGYGSTSSNRRDGQTAIQIFSAAGKYNNTGQPVTYPGLGPGTTDGYHADTADLPYEPPRAHPDDHDPGPTGDLAALLQGGLPGFPWPDFTALGLPAHPSFGYGPIYRGRLASPSVVILADQASPDDLFTGRALCGDAGQHLQGFLRAAGLTKRYAVVRTLPVDTGGAAPPVVAAAVSDSRVQAVLREVLRRAAPKAVVAVGVHASAIAAAVSPAGATVLTMAAHGTSGWLAAWQARLHDLSLLTFPRDTPAAVWSGAPEQIARHDLPYGTLRWQATSGDRAQQAHASGGLSPNYVKIVMPAWAVSTAARPLTPVERAVVDSLR